MFTCLWPDGLILPKDSKNARVTKMDEVTYDTIVGRPPATGTTTKFKRAVILAFAIEHKTFVLVVPGHRGNIVVYVAADFARESNLCMHSAECKTGASGKYRANGRSWRDRQLAHRFAESAMLNCSFVEAAFVTEPGWALSLQQPSNP